MAIQRQRIYIEVEVDQIIRASEARPSHKSGETGHSGRKHVLITNLGLAARADDFRTNMPVACAFAGTPEAVKAVTEALNSPEGQAALQHLDETFPTGIRVRLEAQVQPFTARYSSGMDTVRTASLTSVRIILERIEDAACQGIHIQTAFPILWFDQGRPAWQDSRKAWH